MNVVPFTKMEGCGNDYVFVDGIRSPLPIEHCAELARRWSDRHLGIGGDGLIVLAASELAPVRMLMWNADGSRGAMCGNGLRCLSRLAFDHGHVREHRFAVETDSGLRDVELLDDGQVRTWMGEPRVGASSGLRCGATTLEMVPGELGNPHLTIFVDDVETADVPGIGKMMQADPRFHPDGVNVEFVQMIAADRLRQRTFERGSGETLACGTGAAFAVVAARALGKTTAEVVIVELRGGTLQVEGGGSSLALVGPTRTVFRGEIELPM